MYSRLLLTIAGLASISAPLGGAAWAQERAQVRAPALQRVVDCRAIAATQQRLACYDREVSALDSAEARRELVVMDRQQVRNTRRSLFGLALPDMGIFGEDADGDDAPAQLESTVRGASRNVNGKWILTLADGARWQQVDSREIAPPRSGQAVRIRRAGLGSYLANVNGQTAIRVRRIN
jgi:hypothetical protein